MSIKKIWKIKNSEINEEILNACGGNRVLAVLLKTRGIDSKEKIERFLNPLQTKFLSPDVFNDMAKAAERIQTAVKNNEHITVYGDFDADGVTSTAILYLTLKKIGANVDYYLPDRSAESHGLNTKALVKIIAKKKSKLIITVDCGISNISEVNFAKGFKADVIITDHHEAGEILPEAYAILNPKAKDAVDSSLSVEELQSLNYLAGAGVSFKLSCKLLELYNCEDFVHEILPLAAVGTIGDVVELIGENRSIAAMGIELIKSGKHKGIQKILKSTGLSDSHLLTSETIAFGIVPRLNAAGRLGSPSSALNVLISDDDGQLDKDVNVLNELNSLRQDLCDKTFLDAKEMYEKNLSGNKKSIILFNPDWHIGIIGIVSSKLVEMYNKPVFLMTKDLFNTNIIRCSCRSTSEINIYEILSRHRESFEGFGGHKMAAGFSFDENKISFEHFKNALNITIDEYTQEIDFGKITVEADMLLEPEDISVETVKIIDKMQPFGAGNPSPLFVMNNTVLNQFKMIGQDNKHLKFFISKNNSSLIECLKWNCPDFSIPVGSNLDVLFSMKLNSFNNNITVQLIISDIHSQFEEKNIDFSNIKILDHRHKKNILMQVCDFISTTKKTTAVYSENDTSFKEYKIPDDISDKFFTKENIPHNIEQLMFFDIPESKELFIKIINDTNASIIHLMNFSNIGEIPVDTFAARLSGMLKYALSNMEGIFNINRASRALKVDEDTVECALSLFEDINLADFEKNGNDSYKVFSVHPVELSKIKQNDLYFDLQKHINDINSFRQYYMNTPVEKIKEALLC